MVTEHINYGDALVGARLIGFATTIDVVKSNNPFNSKKQLKLKKTRARNSECYIDQLLRINPVIEEEITEKIQLFCKNTSKIDIPLGFKVFDSSEHMISADTLIIFCEDIGKIIRSAQKHGHNWQCVKGVVGEPAIGYVDIPCFVNKNEKLSLV